MGLIRPRLIDFHNIPVTQASLDFAIPHLEEDIPLYVDPFLLWKSPSQQDQALHTALLNSFCHISFLIKKGKHKEAMDNLVLASECNEVGLGLSRRRIGQRISKKTAKEITEIYKKIPRYYEGGFYHFEEISLYVDGISKDRISDFTCSYLKSFLADFTYDQCRQLGIPTEPCQLKWLYDYAKYSFVAETKVELPVHPTTKQPILFVPKRWLRFSPWINFENYFKEYCPRDDIFNPGEPPSRVKVLNYNRDNYGLVESYVREKERCSSDCKNDPLFRQIPVLSAKRLLGDIRGLCTGNEEKADRIYEDKVSQLLASLLYPHLDFADTQSRTETGVLIRDLIFYNNTTHDFLREIYTKFGSRQLVMELKNVRKIEREHVNQLNRYLSNEFGSFGVLVTRNPLPQPIFRNTVDLWSGQRRCIVGLNDEDLEMMVNVFETKQRLPIEVLKKKYVEFSRACPS